ncbi:MAG: acyl-CoA thioesterase [Cyanobacteria bacterium SIG26]|nr:acyl-CoA thioesterase [Cyanobacteria bacterium SIG26]MBQ7126052.1 acyl-CoA thioesterase [bacterium]
MNKHIFEQRVFYADTDSYGIVWHGSYLRWMEMGRVYWTEMMGLGLIDLRDNHDIVIPVAGVNIKYKMSAKVDDIMVVETQLQSYNGLSAVFKQVISNKETGKVYIDAEVTVVAVNREGKLYRRIPSVLSEVFEQEMKCLQLV